MTEVVFGPCCFCGQQIESSRTDPCSVVVETADGKVQVWSAHGACFKKRLADPYPDAPGFLDPAFF
jgi:hypothetical protein